MNAILSVAITVDDVDFDKESICKVYLQGKELNIPFTEHKVKNQGPKSRVIQNTEEACIKTIREVFDKVREEADIK